MTFDDQLRRTFDSLADRVKAEVESHLRAAAAELASSLEADRASAAGQAAADARAAADKDIETRLHDAVSAAHDRALETGRSEGRRDGEEAGRLADLTAGERLVDAIRSIDRARSLSEILDTLVSCASRETARAGVLLVQSGHLKGWRFIGFGPAIDDAGGLELALADAGVTGAAVRTGAAASADGMRGSSPAPAFADVPEGRESLAVPVVMSGQVVAVLYADQGAAAVVPGQEPRAAWPATLEIMARHAARCLETLTAFRAAQVLTEGPDITRSASQDRSALEHSAEKDAEEEQAARRFARLLISDIKLYHEAEVIAGRREHDLATRLGGEIARARVQYEERVPAHIRRQTDHFDAELVRTLANGDASLLGQTALEN